MVLNLKINVEIANVAISDVFMETLKYKIENMVQEAFLKAENEEKECVTEDDLPVDLSFEDCNDLDNILITIKEHTDYHQFINDQKILDEEFENLHTKIKHNLEIKQHE